jgi:hypothetical protein
LERGRTWAGAIKISGPVDSHTDVWYYSGVA